MGVTTPESDAHEPATTWSLMVDRLVGQGGMGRVYQVTAEDSALAFSRRYALKVVLSGGKPGSKVAAELERRLRDEARLLAMIHDRAVVPVHRIYTLEGQPAILMDYVHGCSVGGAVRQGPVPPAAALAIIAETARALTAIHDQPGPTGASLRVIHRDLKPDNLMVTQDGQVRILDFGIAKACFQSREARTTQQRFGTAGYMAPERYQRDGEDTAAVDVFSLGVILEDLLVGEEGVRNPGPVAAALHKAKALSVSMTADAPSDRPPMDTVEHLCNELIAALPEELRRPGLAEWARTLPMGQLGESTADVLVGARLREVNGRLVAPGPLRFTPEPRAESSFEWPATAEATQRAATAPEEIVQRPRWPRRVGLGGALTALTAVALWTVTPYLQGPDPADARPPVVIDTQAGGAVEVELGIPPAEPDEAVPAAPAPATRPSSAPNPAPSEARTLPPPPADTRVEPAAPEPEAQLEPSLPAGATVSAALGGGVHAVTLVSGATQVVLGPQPLEVSPGPWHIYARIGAHAEQKAGAVTFAPGDARTISCTELTRSCTAK
jgi:serine/threonine-protein kinase